MEVCTEAKQKIHHLNNLRKKGENMNLNNRKDINVWVCHYFKLHYSEIWDKYRRYGEAVLDADLGDTEGEIREICITSERKWEFLDRIERFWKDKFQVFLRNPSDILKMLELGREGAWVEGSENAQHDDLVLVSKDFFETLRNNASKNNLVCLLINDNIYLIMLEIEKMDKGIKVQDIIATKNIIRE